MASIVKMKHQQSGLVKKGFYGFSWTTLCWNCFPAFIRGDAKNGFIIMGTTVLVALVSTQIPGRLGHSIAVGLSIGWAYAYNKMYTTDLLEKGYEFADEEATVLQAKKVLKLEKARTVNG